MEVMGEWGFPFFPQTAGECLTVFPAKATRRRTSRSTAYRHEVEGLISERESQPNDDPNGQRHQNRAFVVIRMDISFHSALNLARSSAFRSSLPSVKYPWDGADNQPQVPHDSHCLPLPPL